VIFADRTHIQSKKATQTIESHNGRLRHFLARLARRTKCYSKSLEMLEASLILFFARKMPASAKTIKVLKKIRIAIGKRLRAPYCCLR